MKKIAVILSLILCLATFLISPSAQAAEGQKGEKIWVQSTPTFTAQGGSVYHSISTDPKTWNLVEGTEDRDSVYHINFKEPLKKPPTVTVALTGMDVDNVGNNRIVLAPDNITETGFDLDYSTFENAKVYSVWLSWAAYGDND